MASKFSTTRKGFSLIELLIIIAIIAVLTALLVPAVGRIRQAASMTECINNLKQMGVGVHAHYDTFGYFPTAGDGTIGARSWSNGISGGTPAIGKNQTWSWMYQLLPYVSQDSLWAAVTGGNNGDDCIKQSPVNVYSCPSRRSGIVLPLPNGALNDYVGNGGAGLNGFSTPAWNPGLNTNYTKNGGHGVIACPSPLCTGNVPLIRIASISDGASNTILIGEKSLDSRWYRGGKGNDNQGYWRGRDSDTLGGIFSPAKGFIYAPTQDTSFSHSYNFSQTFSMFGSAHASGFNVVLCDGSARVIRYEISVNAVLLPLCVRDDGLVFSLDDP